MNEVAKLINTVDLCLCWHMASLLSSEADLDEIRSLKISPPPVAQAVLCCVASMLDPSGMAMWQDASATRVRLASWEEAQRLLAKKDFKAMLVAAAGGCTLKSSASAVH